MNTISPFKIGLRTSDSAVSAWLMVPGREAMLLASVNRQLCEKDMIVFDQFKALANTMAGVLCLEMFGVAPEAIREEKPK